MGVLAMGLGLGFKFISMILKGSENTLNLLISPYPRISRHLYVFPDLPCFK